MRKLAISKGRRAGKTSLSPCGASLGRLYFEFIGFNPATAVIYAAVQPPSTGNASDVLRSIGAEVIRDT